MSAFGSFRQSPTLSAMLTFAGWQRGFTSHDKAAMIEGLDVIRTAMVQPVGTAAAGRVKGAVSGPEWDRAVMQVLASAMVMWLSGALDRVEVIE